MKLDYPVVLASGSPRRQQLLKEIIPVFEISVPNVDEEELQHADPWITAQKTAKAKALAGVDAYPESLIVAGDTVVAMPENGDWGKPGDIVNWVQFVKPIDAEDAFNILKKLSGKTHVVVTGVCLIWPGGMSAFTDSTKVTFKTMSDDEIRAYISTGEPMDKAGAYGFQGGARPFVAKVEGSISNVVGLPMEKLEEALRSVSARS